MWVVFYCFGTLLTPTLSPVRSNNLTTGSISLVNEPEVLVPESILRHSNMGNAESQPDGMPSPSRASWSTMLADLQDF
jgi:hypothetical protein